MNTLKSQTQGDWQVSNYTDTPGLPEHLPKPTQKVIRIFGILPEEYSLKKIIEETGIKPEQYDHIDIVVRYPGTLIKVMSYDANGVQEWNIPVSSGYIIAQNTTMKNIRRIQQPFQLPPKQL